MILGISKLFKAQKIMMKAIIYDLKENDFCLKEIEQPKLETEEDVIIKTLVTSINPVDVKIALWKDAFIPKNEDYWVCGLDIIGTVVETGKSVTNFKVGEKVITHGNMGRKFGGFAEYTVQNSKALLKAPNKEATQAVATPCVAWSAYQALHNKLNLNKEDSLFIAGGNGSVGRFAIQMAKNIGVKTIIATASTESIGELEQIGATSVIDYKKEDIIKKVMELTQSRGVTKAFDTVGQGNDIIAANVLGFAGHMVALVDTIDATKYIDAFSKNLSFHQVSLGAMHKHGRQDMLLNIGNKINKMLENNELTINNIKVINPQEALEAIKDVQTKQSKFKYVIDFG